MLAFNETLYFKFIIHPFVGVRVGILDGEHKTDKKPTLRLGIKGRNNSKKLYEYKERGKTFVKGLYLTERPISSTGEKQF
ncbi:hypothetical protein EI555_015216, partial [Monodon monoceros]